MQEYKNIMDYLMDYLEVLVPVTGNTLHPQSYWLANPDVASVRMDPAEHFRLYGYKEKRQQLLTRAEN